jgi:hypothetical protein
LFRPTSYYTAKLRHKPEIGTKYRKPFSKRVVYDTNNASFDGFINGHNFKEF